MTANNIFDKLISVRIMERPPNVLHSDVLIASDFNVDVDFVPLAICHICDPTNKHVVISVNDLGVLRTSKWVVLRECSSSSHCSSGRNELVNDFVD